MAEITQESIDAYEKALKMGQRDYNARLSAGEDGYLPSLDEQQRQFGTLAYVSLPMRELMLDRICGTFTVNRAHSFSGGYYPLHPRRSEFATKWKAVYSSHMEEGLRDPIKVYEYLWQYYVIEGNKRVSVLKYLGAASYPAEITRLIPQRSEATEVYFAYLAYEKVGLFQGLQLSSAEKYDQLLALEARLAGELDADTRAHPDSLYNRFLDLYAPLRCALAPGDAFLEYLLVYGANPSESDDEWRANLTAFKPQLDLLAHPAEPLLVLDSEIAEPSLFTRLFALPKTAQLVFAYGRGRTETNWLGAHERGRQAMQAELGERVSSSIVENLSEEDAYEKLCESARDADLLLVVSPSLMVPALRFSLENPKCPTLLYTRLQGDFHINTYFGRYYEAVFLCGVAAGLATRTGRVCYISPQVASHRFTSDINAFALGVRTVSAHAETFFYTKDVRQNDVASVRQAMREMARRGADVAFAPRYEAPPLEGMPGEDFAAMVEMDREGAPTRYLASPGWNWDEFYTRIARSFLSGGLELLRDVPGVAGFWWGLGDQVIDFHYSSWAPPTSANLLRYLRGGIEGGQYNPFHGPVYDRDGQLRIAEHGNPFPMEIMRMDWLVDCVRTVEEMDD